MPFPNEHSARIKDPSEFDPKSFRSKDIADGVRIITGKLKNGDGAMVTQTYRLKADKFTVAEAKDWLKKNNVHYISFEAATNSKNMENAVLKIYGDIGDGGITSDMVSEFLDQNKDSKEITVRINSRGGEVSEGWSIYDLLVNSGKKIRTICEGKVFSIATIIFLAGSDREIMSNADGLIHNPFIPGDNLSGDYGSGDLLTIADVLKQEESKILDFYVEKTGTDKAKLAEYMLNDTKLSADDMLTLGFATKIIEPVKAYAYIKSKINVMNENDVKTFGEKIDAIMDKIKNLTRLTPQDQTITDKDGKKLVLTKPTGEPVVGDDASPDGSYALANGKTVTILNGKVTEVKDATIAKTELELAKEKIATLEAKVTELEKNKIYATAAKTAAETEKVSAEAEKVKATALVTELQGLKNSWKPESRQKFNSAEKVGDIDLNQVREIMKKINNKKE
jgi:ATP-dependent protease ClpP protease subunit